MSKLYTLLQGLTSDGKLTMMEAIAVAAACELAADDCNTETIGTAVHPVLKELIKEPVHAGL